jgi:4-alpha-glucanotransferase
LDIPSAHRDRAFHRTNNAMPDPHAPLPRSSGVLMHVSSLPSAFGIGDLGPAAYAWVDQLIQAGQSWWQVLPLCPIGQGDSPYDSYSSVGANPLFISPELLVEDGLLDRADLHHGGFPDHSVHFLSVRQFKATVLDRAWQNFSSEAGHALREEFEAFLHDQAGQLDEFALFMALKHRFGGAKWFEWPAELALRNPEALASVQRELADRIRQECFAQFLAVRQWQRLKRYANERGLRVIGDLPIFVSVDSVDVWAYPDQFLLDEHRRPRVVAGVPPDYFSPTGQLWGNPLYDWNRMRHDGYAWWTRRLRSVLRNFDLIRLDHFRGLESAWNIPAGAETAQVGRWEPGPGADFLNHVRSTFGGLPMIAEDLGLITNEVQALRKQFDLPGMRVLQFAFDGDPNNWFLPHNYDLNSVVYTGTHDNDTTLGWYLSLTDDDRHRVRTLTHTDGSDIVWDLIRLAWSSIARVAIVPVQDLLVLDSSARMNRPGIAAGNWEWRMTPDQPIADALSGLRHLTGSTDRLPRVF